MYVLVVWNPSILSLRGWSFWGICPEIQSTNPNHQIAFDWFSKSGGFYSLTVHFFLFFWYFGISKLMHSDWFGPARGMHELIGWYHDQVSGKWGLGESLHVIIIHYMSLCDNIYIYVILCNYRSPTISGWWFGTFFIFPYIGFLIIPIDFHIFQRGSNH